MMEAELKVEQPVVSSEMELSSVKSGNLSRRSSTSSIDEDNRIIIVSTFSVALGNHSQRPGPEDGSELRALANRVNVEIRENKDNTMAGGSGRDVVSMGVANMRKRLMVNTDLEIVDESEDSQTQNGAKRRCPEKPLYNSICSTNLVTVENSKSETNDEDSDADASFHYVVEEFPALESTESGDKVKVNAKLEEEAVSDHTTHHEVWNKLFNDRTLRERYWNMWTAPPTLSLCDVRFDKDLHANRLLLSLFCKNSDFRSTLNDSCKNGNRVDLSIGIDFEAFWLAIQFLYSNKLDSQLPESDLIEVLRVARYLQFEELGSECLAQMGNINCNNVLHIFLYAVAFADVELRKRSTKYITKNIKEILTSSSFYALSNAELCAFLQNDDWYIEDEYQVFIKVVKWGFKRVPERPPTADELRTVLGPALFQIRFASMDVEVFYTKVFQGCAGLISEEESAQIRSDGFCNTNFNLNPRRRRKAVFKQNEEASTSVNLPANKESKPKPGAHTTPSKKCEPKPTVTPAKSKESKRLPSVQPIPKTPQRRESLTTEKPSASEVKVPTLVDYIKSLSNKMEDELRSIEDIKEKVKIPTIIQQRITLHNLKNFHLDLASSKPWGEESGSALKRYFRNKLNSISDLLFFDKNPDENDGEQSVIRKAFLSKVNIKVTCGKIVFLNIDHVASALTMFYMHAPNAQAIVDAAKDIPFKLFAAGECEISSLDSLDKTTVETLILRRVKDLDNHETFLKNFPNLKEFCDFSPMSTPLDLVSCTQQCNNSGIRKLAMHKVKLSPPQVEIELKNSLLQELYLDNCDFDCTNFEQYRKYFPHLKRVSLYGVQNSSKIIHTILQYGSLEWLYVWKMRYTKLSKACKKKGGTPLHEDSIKLREFLGGVFGMEDANQDDITFKLERKPSAVLEPILLSSNGNLCGLNPDHWNGEILKLKPLELFRQTSKIDFHNFSWNQYYGDFSTFYLWNTTDADFNREKNKRAQQVKESRLADSPNVNDVGKLNTPSKIGTASES